MLTNAKEEFLECFDVNNVECATINLYQVDYNSDNYNVIEVKANLFVGYNEQNLQDFLAILNTINYYSGYGSPVLFGTVWLKDGTWADRGEYDGSEWWELHMRPEIPEELKEFEKIS